MRKTFLSLLIFLSMFFMIQCSDEEPTKSSADIEFIVTAKDHVPQLQSNVGPWLSPTDYLNLRITPRPGFPDDPLLPPIGQAVCFIDDPRSTPQNMVTYPPRDVSIEFKPEIRFYLLNSTSYKVAEIPAGTPNDPEYFGRTPYDTVCVDAMRTGNNADSNYQFPVTTKNEKVVGIFKKKFYDNADNWKNDATMIIDVRINGVLWKTFQTEEIEGGLTIIVPIQ